MEAIERQILAALVATEGAAGETLWTQYEQASVLRREVTGVGFFTYFAVPDAAPRLLETRNPIGRPILIELEGLRHGAGALLWTKDGALDRLEVGGDGLDLPCDHPTTPEILTRSPLRKRRNRRPPKARPESPREKTTP